MNDFHREQDAASRPMTAEHVAAEHARVAAEAAKRAAEASRVPTPFEAGPAWSRPELEAMEAERVNRAAAAVVDAEQAALAAIRNAMEGR